MWQRITPAGVALSGGLAAAAAAGGSGASCARSCFARLQTNCPFHGASKARSAASQCRHQSTWAQPVTRSLRRDSSSPKALAPYSMLMPMRLRPGGAAERGRWAHTTAHHPERCNQLTSVNSMDASKAQEILDFWFGTTPEELGKTRREWFMKNDAFDDQIRQKFGGLLDEIERDHKEGSGTGFMPSAADPQTLLAYIVATDQFPRNIFRGSPRSFAFDPLALKAANLLVESGADKQLRPTERTFAYLPFEHSEALADQERSLALFKSITELPGYYDYAVKHHVIIQRFGRFPHRNAVLGRESTPEETEFLTQPGSSF